MKLLFNRLIQELDANGSPYTGAKLFTYEAGTSTKAATYQDSAGSTPHANPIVLDSAGRVPAAVWGTEGQAYKLVLAPANDTDPPASPIWTIASVSGINDIASVLSQWVASSLTPTYISASSFSLAGDQTTNFHVGRRLKITDAGGTKYAVIKTSVFTTLTTITVVVDGGGSLSSPTSAVAYGLASADNHAQPLLTDTNFLISGSSDKTKKVRFEADGLTTDTTRTLTVPDASTTIVGTDATQTLTNKTVSGAATASSVTMGTGSGTGTHVVVAYVNPTAVGNVGAGEDDLMTYSVPANTLSANNKALRIKAWGTTTNNANAKTLRFYWGAGTAIGITLNTSIAARWAVEIIIIRTGASAQDLIFEAREQSGAGAFAAATTLFVMNQFFTRTETDTASITTKFTGQATTDNDIVQEGMVVEFLN